MTIRDPEVLEALRDDPELLALADAVAETQRLPHRSRRRAISRSAVLVAAGAVALLLALFWPGGSGQNGVLDRALAAIGNGPVMHLVTRSPIGFELQNLRTGRKIVPTYDLESWSDQGNKRFHLIMRVKGRIVGEVLFPEDQGRDDITLEKVDPAYAALWSGYRQALASGKAKIERRGVLYDRPVYWLRFPSAVPHRPGSLVAIDRKSYRPLAFRSEGSGGQHLDYRILLARTEPLSASAFMRRNAHAPSPFEGSDSGEMSTQLDTLHVGKPWLIPSRAVGGLKLSTIYSRQVMSGGKTSKGVELVYGPDGDPSRSFRIDELREQAVPPESKSIPRGFIRISGAGGLHRHWTVDLVQRGVYVTIETGLSRSAALEVARTLRPA